MGAELKWCEVNGCYSCTNCGQKIGEFDYKYEEGWSYCPGCGEMFSKIWLPDGDEVIIE